MFTAVQDFASAQRDQKALDSRPRILYLHERDGWFYFKRRIPAAIQWAFGGAKEVWKSLETSKLDEAVRALNVQVKGRPTLEAAWCGTLRRCAQRWAWALLSL